MSLTRHGAGMDVVVWLRGLGLERYEAAFRENEIDETVLQNLTAEDLKELGVAALTPPQDAALFAELLSLPNDGRYPTLDLSPQQRRQRTLEALTTQLEALSRQKPPLMIFEDVHWIDPTSLEALGRTVDRIRTLGVLLIVTYRPDFEPPWIGQPHVTALTINRLGEREIDAMIDARHRQQSLPENIRQDIIERTDGIPLFVEEMTRAVLEAKDEAAAAQAIPGSVAKHCCSCKPARLVNGAARPAWSGQGSRADRGGDRTRVHSCSAGCGGAQAGGGA